MKILICPLNWGLGHATRCVPIIYSLAKENEIIIISDGFPLNFLKNEFPKEKFPQISFDIFASYSISYSKGKFQVGAMIYSLPKIIFGIIKEHLWLQNYVRQHQIDKIISDNRFGMWSKRTFSVYITHQLMVKMPPKLQFLEKPIWRLHRWFIKHYDECWIPDFEDKDNALSGDLSHKYPLLANTKFIGTLSRFQILKNIEPDNSFSTVCILSGVEPQRSIFENFLLDKFKNSMEKILIIEGKPQSEIKKIRTGNITIISHLSTEKIAAYLVGCQKIICRSGYSSIMDLAALNCLHKAEFYPTSGQTEQEYLAEYLNFRLNGQI
ncbi:MAG: hypothetical protein FWF72_03885 [Paludibacter sp.]|nr:hypothetical protein [Paludibacter sp.]